MQSPFLTHRAKVLGHYSTASWLRSAVMSLWNSTEHHVRLDRLASTDQEHFSAFIEMVTYFRLHGEGDPAFQQLVQEVDARIAKERNASERARQFEAWCEDAASALRRLGKSTDLVDDRYNWFEQRFDAGDSPDVAAAECQPIPTEHE